MKTLINVVLDIVVLAAFAGIVVVLYQALVTKGIIDPIFQSKETTEVYFKMGTEELKDSIEYFKLMFENLLG